MRKYASKEDYNISQLNINLKAINYVYYMFQLVTMSLQLDFAQSRIKINFPEFLF